MADDDHPIRIERERTLHVAYGPDQAARIPPPYPVRGVDFIYVTCSLEQVAARAALPPGLELAEPAAGVVTAFTVADGWAIAPFSAGFVSIGVKGYDALDGAPGQYICAGWYSGTAGATFRAHNRNLRTGSASLSLDGARFAGTVEAETGPLYTIRGLTTDRKGPLVSGINHYLGVTEHGPTLNSVTHTSRWRDATDVSIDIHPAAPDILRLLRPKVLWPLIIREMSMVYGTPQHLPEASNALAAAAVSEALLTVFSTLGRPAAIVARDGRLVALNPQAEDLVGDCLSVAGGRLSAFRNGERKAFAAMIDKALETDSFAGPVLVTRQQAASPLIAQAQPVAKAVVCEKAVLVFLIDPARPASADVAEVLQLMGLTPAEARIAALVGGGIPPRQAAEQLEITENTLRSTTRIVYEKLGIARQADLAHIVARLDSVGIA